jgi:hypothetical protein
VNDLRFRFFMDHSWRLVAPSRVSIKTVPQDYVKAVTWFRLAANQGDDYAQSKLGFMYHQGHGVGQDYAEAARWFRLAANQGSASAQASLGLMYAEGYGVAQNLNKARKWFTLADVGNNTNAAKHRSLIESKMLRNKVYRVGELDSLNKGFVGLLRQVFTRRSWPDRTTRGPRPRRLGKCV